MKKILGLSILMMLVVLPQNIFADDESIAYREIRTSAVLANDTSILSDTIDSNVDKTLNKNETWSALTSEYISQDAFENPFVVFPEPEVAYVFYYYEINYMDGSIIRGFEKEISYDELIAKKDAEIDEVIFYYSHGGSLKVNYKLDSLDGIDLKESDYTTGRVYHDHDDSNNVRHNSLADTFTIDSEIEGYELIHSTSELNGIYELDAKEITLVYKKKEIKEDIPVVDEPVVDVPVVDEPVVDQPVGELPAIIDPVDKDPELDGVLSVTKDPLVEEVLSVNEVPAVLPSTGMAVNYTPFVLVLLGFVMILFRNNNE